MAQIKIDNVIYGSNNASDIIYNDMTVADKLNAIPIFDPSDNANIEANQYDYLTYGHIINHLDSDAADKVLSANQGRILSEKIDNIDFNPLETEIRNNADNIVLLDEQLKLADTEIKEINSNLFYGFNSSWYNDCDVFETIEAYINASSVYATFTLAFGSNITNAPEEGCEWFTVLYKSSIIIAYTSNALWTNARNGSKDNYTGWQKYISQNELNNAINKIENYIHKSVENYEDYWKLEMSATCSNTLDAFKASKPHRTVYIHDSATSVTMNMADSYTAKCTTNVLVDIDKNLTFTVTTDDASAVYVNKTLIANLATCTATSVTLPLKAGWNEIIVIYTEGSGADGWQFTPKLSASSDILRMNALRDI